MVLARFAAVRPYAVVPCATPADVRSALDRAARDGRPIAVRGGGHCFAGRSSTTGLVLDTGPMTGVTVDGDRAVIGAGTRLAEVYGRLAAHGRTLPAGCGPTVGIAGLTLGGGLGVLGRRYGLTSDSLIGATMVTPGGQVVEAGDDLLWALRGGGAPGVVTSLTFTTVPVPAATGFRLTYPAAAATAVLDAWQHLLPELPDEVAPSLVITAWPVTVSVFGTTPDDAAVDRLIRRLGPAPLADRRHHGDLPAVKTWLAGDGGDESRAAYLHSEFFRGPVPAAGLIERLTAGPAPDEHRELDFTPWGGAYGRVPADATAFPHRDALFLLKQSALVPVGRRISGWLAESAGRTGPHGTGGAYPNFPEPGRAAEAYHLGNLARLRRIRAAYDPAGTFSPAHP